MSTSAAALTTNTTAYHHARRSPNVCRRRSFQFEDIADPAHGMNQFRREPLVDFLAQAEHQHIDDIGSGIERVVPHMRQDHCLRDDPSGVAHQVLEECELAGPELDLPSTDRKSTRLNSS